MSRLDDYLTHNIDGYLVYDLSTMSKNDADGNGVGYPLLMSTCAGIEFLGGLLSSTPFKTFGLGHVYFGEYWTTYLYPSPSAHNAFGKLTYQLARHGIAHAFALKGEIGVLRHNPALHFTCNSSGVLTIDAVQLASDFIASYRDRVRPLLTAPASAIRISMESQLAEMERVFRDQAAKEKEGVVFASAPVVQGTTVTTQSVAPSSSTAAGSAAPPSPPPGPSGPWTGPTR